MSGPLAALLVIGVGLGGYAWYRHVEKSKEPSGPPVRRGRGGFQAKGYFAGASIYGVDYVSDGDARSDHRPEARMFLVKPYQIFNPGGGMRPFEIDAVGQETGRKLVLPGEQPPRGASAGSFVFVGQGSVKPPDPRNCLCPQDVTYFDPLNPKLPEYKCSCNAPGAVKPPYAGFYATGRAGRQHHHHRMRQRGGQPPMDDDS